MSNRLTPWFLSKESLPTGKGVYQARARGFRKAYYSYFDGKTFHGCWSNANEAATVRWAPGRCYSTVTHWRGLTEKP